MPTTCSLCGDDALSTREFESACRAAGFVQDTATGQWKMKVGGLAGTSEQVHAALGRQERSRQATYDEIENQRGYQCKGCMRVYCMKCLYAQAPAHPSGGKACPRCGQTFTRYGG